MRTTAYLKLGQVHWNFGTGNWLDCEGIHVMTNIPFYTILPIVIKTKMLVFSGLIFTGCFWSFALLEIFKIYRILARVCSSFGNAAILDIISHCLTCWLFLLSSFCPVGSLQNILLSRRAGFAACKGQRCLGKKGENGPAGYFHALTNVQEVTIQKYQSKGFFL